MQKEAKLTKRSEFVAIYGEGRSWANSLLVLRALPNELGHSRCGFSVNKSVGNAVIRNRVKRLLREVVRSSVIKSGWDIVLIARPAAASANYHQLREAIEGLLKRAHLRETGA